MSKYEYIDSCKNDPADLADEGTECSPELVRQIMRSQGLVACQTVQGHH